MHCVVCLFSFRKDKVIYQFNFEFKLNISKANLENSIF